MTILVSETWHTVHKGENIAHQARVTLYMTPWVVSLTDLAFEAALPDVCSSIRAKSPGLENLNFSIN